MGCFCVVGDHVSTVWYRCTHRMRWRVRTGVIVKFEVLGTLATDEILLQTRGKEERNVMSNRQFGTMNCIASIGLEVDVFCQCFNFLC